MKELIPVPSQRILKWQIPRWLNLRRWMKEFCWFFLTLFITLEIITFVIFGFPKASKYIYQPLTVAFSLVGFLLTSLLTCKYRECDIKTENEPKAKTLFIAGTAIEHVALWGIAYAVYLIVFWASLL